jgi:hypothetical protein
MKCYYLLEDGTCDGLYKGFACIGRRCRAEKEPPCEHYVQGFYCSKYRRFGCVGLSNCTGDIVEDYARVRRERAKT